MRACVAAGLVLIAACAPDDLTEVILETDTDFEVGTELIRIEWSLSSSVGELDPSPSIDLAPGDEAMFPLTLTVLPGGADDAAFEVVARGYGPAGLLVEQRRTSAFVPGVSSVMRLELSKTCVSVGCDAAETCSQGTCVSAEVALPVFARGRPHGTDELCNARDDDADGTIDEGYDTMVDPVHCGGCFATCPERASATSTCTNGLCDFVCNEGQGDCDTVADNGCETTLDDPGNCGGCDVECEAPTLLCSVVDEPTCVDRCGVGAMDCSGSCVNLEDDANHCGRCDNVCEDLGVFGDHPCVAGECVPSCDPGYHLCPGTCADDASVLSCGDRCDPCPEDGPNVAAVSCTDGACGVICDDGFADCNGDPSDGCEVALDTDANHCSECGLDCGYGTCADGACSNAVTSVALGPRHTCAALADGLVYCWGANESGQSVPYDARTTIPTPARARPGGASNTYIFDGTLDDRTTYVRRNRGANYLNAWGLDPREDPATAGTLCTEDDYVFSSLGAFGYDSGGGAAVLVGSGVPATGLGDRRNDAFGPYDNSWPPGDFSSAMSLGGAFTGLYRRGDRVTCLAAFNNTVQCFGTGDAANPAYVGNGTDTGSATAYTNFITRLHIGTEMAVGFAAVCAPSTADPGPFMCWGAWDCGSYTASPTNVPGIIAREAPGITVGESYACTTTIGTGRVLCWGRHLVGGGCADEPIEPFPEVDDALRVELSRNHGCYIRRAGGGSLYCWGSNTEGQLGTDGPAGPSAPDQVVFANTTPPPACL